MSETSIPASSEADGFLQRILRARVYDVAIESPLDPAPILSARLGNRVLLKREDLQPVFSFKLRGAYNKMVGLSAAELERGVIAASAGNHAQGVAMAAQRLGCRAVIVMPVTTPDVKVKAVAARGAEVVLHGDGYDDACAEALRLAAALRLSMADVLKDAHDGCLPLVFDDAFTNSDPERIDLVKRMLSTAVERGLQVVLLTCAPEAYGSFADRVVELAAPGDP